MNRVSFHLPFRFLRQEHAQLLGPVWAKDTVTSPFSPDCCLQCSLADLDMQQLDEEVLSTQTALTSPFCPFNSRSAGSEIQVQVHFKTISEHDTDITGFPHY